MKGYKTILFNALALPALCLLLAACGARDTVLDITARGIDEACARGLGVLAIEARKQVVRDVNARTATGNHTASDCDSDGQPDFAIDANGIPLPDPAPVSEAPPALTPQSLGQVLADAAPEVAAAGGARLPTTGRLGDNIVVAVP